MLCFSARRARLVRAGRRHSASRLIRVWDMAGLLMTCEHWSVPTGVYASVLAGVRLGVPQPDRAASAIPAGVLLAGSHQRRHAVV
jgi:hypothetical protein